MDEKGLKIFLAVLQSIIVILLVYFLSFVRETEIERSSMVILYLLHFFVFYFSSYGNNFFKRGYLVEFNSTIRYIFFLCNSYKCIKLFYRGTV